MRLLVISILFLGMCAAQEIPLGDLARSERARREADEIANFKLGTQPQAALAGESIPAHFLTITGGAANGEFELKLNGATMFHNTYVHDLPIYISSMMLDGGNLLEVTFVPGQVPLVIIVDERRPGIAEHKVLARFESEPATGDTPVTKQVRFYAEPKAFPPFQLTEADRTAIWQQITAFFNSLDKKDSKQMLALFAPAIEDVRPMYPEGAAYGNAQMAKMAELIANPELAMEPLQRDGVEMIPRGAVVVVRRSDRQPVFTSNAVSVGGGTKTSVSAESILVKKIRGQWRLTLPFGF